MNAPRQPGGNGFIRSSNESAVTVSEQSKSGKPAFELAWTLPEQARPQ